MADLSAYLLIVVGSGLATLILAFAANSWPWGRPRDPCIRDDRQSVMMPLMETLDPGDMVLLILGAPTSDPDQEGRCAGITRLEKLAFLVEESSFAEHAAVSAQPLHFKPYHYGPYTREIYDAIDLLTGIGLVTETRNPSDTSLDSAEELSTLEGREFGLSGADPTRPYVERVFELTPKGKYIAEVIGGRVGERAVREISDIKDQYGSLPLRQLLQNIYRDHPAMASKSRIRDSL